MAFREVEPETSATFHNDDFTDTVKDIYVDTKEIGDNEVDALTIEFENSVPLDILLPQSFPEFKDIDRLGRFVKSLTAFGYKLLYDDESHQIDFKPDLRGETLSFKTNEKNYTDKKSGEQKVFQWWTVESIENGSNEPEDDETVEECKNLIMSIVDDYEIPSKSIISKQIIEKAGGRTEAKPYQKVRDKALSELVNEGTLEYSGGKYCYPA